MNEEKQQKSVATGVANKAEQIQAVMKHLPEGTKKSVAENAYVAVFAALSDLANEGKKFTTPIGTFDHTKTAGGRELRNPSTGKPTGEVSKDKHKFKFKASSTLSIPQP